MPSLVTRLSGVVTRAIEDPGKEYRRLRWRCGLPVFEPLPEGVGVYLYPGEEISRHLRFLDFERAVRRVLLDVVRPGMTFVDAGANLGLYTVIAAKLVGHSGRVFAFEPSEREWRRARRSIASNGLKNVELHRAALSEADGTVSLTVCEPAYGGFNSLGTVTHHSAAGHVSHQEQVRCWALDSFLSEKNVERVDVMKLDVEGAEGLVLRGGKKLFSRPDAPILFCELSDWTAAGVGTTAAEIWDLIASYKYSLYSIEKSETGYALARCEKAARVDYADIMALKPAHVAQLGTGLRERLAVATGVSGKD